ncbi:MAG: SDR family oxidoreductase [Pirellulales bacterium]|nr:SDR family oxidoreductase [Pirellulales bacterium]
MATEPLRDKTALVTGGGSGIGAAIVQSFAMAGAKVVVAGRRQGKLEEVAAACADTPGEVIVFTANVADRADVQRLFTSAIAELGHIDILVNNAGVNIPNRSTAEVTPEDWDRLLSINATGAFNCSMVALPGMRERKSGVIVNISSVAGKRAWTTSGVAYNASKFAMTALGTSLAQEENEHGIRVCNVYPGEVNTDIMDRRPNPPTAEYRANLLQPEDVAQAVTLLVTLPPRAHVQELVIKPTSQGWM